MNNSRLVYSTGGGYPPRDHREPDERRQERKLRAGPRKHEAIPRDGVVRVFRERAGRKGKEVTVIRGLAGPESTLRTVAAELKRSCGAGGSTKDGVIEIQGDHRQAVLRLLEKRGLRVKLAGG